MSRWCGGEAQQALVVIITCKRSNVCPCSTCHRPLYSNPSRHCGGRGCPIHTFGERRHCPAIGRARPCLCSRIPGISIVHSVFVLYDECCVHGRIGQFRPSSSNHRPRRQYVVSGRVYNALIGVHSGRAYPRGPQGNGRYRGNGATGGTSGTNGIRACQVPQTSAHRSAGAEHVIV